MLNDSDREQASELCACVTSSADCPKHGQTQRGAEILHRLVPAPDHGAGFRRDPETGFVYYSSEWLSDAREDNE